MDIPQKVARWKEREENFWEGRKAMGMLDVLIARTDQSFARFNVEVCRHFPPFGGDVASW
jgi:hypothetical protein